MALSKTKMKYLLENDRPGEKEAAGIPAKEEPDTARAETNTVKGLVLSEIQFKPLEWFKYNPENEIFRDCKSDEYFESLKRDISEANAILNPLISMPDGLIVEGESRHLIATTLYTCGRSGFAKIPTRIILSPITPGQVRERLYLGNLSRFDIPYTVKLYAYSQIWPDYFLPGSSHKPGKKQSVPEEQADERVTTKKEIAAATGLSESQIKRNKAVIQKAVKLAETENAGLSVKHLEKVQAQKQEANDHDLSPEEKRKAVRKAFYAFFARKKEYLGFASKFVEMIHVNKLISDGGHKAIKALLEAFKEDKKI
jgi:hypothetical protein